jgi:hypothetical protein
MAEKAHGYSVTALKWLMYLTIAVVLGLTFAAYLSPSLRVELANFWAMCVAALR